MSNDGLHRGNINLEGLPEQLKQPLTFLENKLGKDRPEVLIVLGSGLSDVMSGVKVLHSIPYSSIPQLPLSTVSGHLGVLELVEYNGKKIAIMRGRFHIYEQGNTPDNTVRLIRVIGLLGIKAAILSSASGSTSLKHKPGALILMKDHIDITRLSPLSSEEASTLGPRFVDVSELYSIKLRKKILSAAKKERIKICEGVYAYMKGPQYETAAEVHMMGRLGADLVGMSTVHEVIALRQLNIDTAFISTATNYGTGVVKGKKLNHEEVKEIGKKTSANLDRLLKRVLTYPL